MGAAAEDGIEEPVLETGTYIQLGGITTEKTSVELFVWGLALTNPNWKPSNFSL